VGKSTILNGVHRVLRVIAPKFIVAYHEITEDHNSWKLPTELLEHAARQVMRDDYSDEAAAAPDTCSNIEFYTEVLPRKGYYSILLIDEV
jgi:hypothetical protein